MGLLDSMMASVWNPQQRGAGATGQGGLGDVPGRLLQKT